jgi:DNA-binding MarR family transcriptional regulator
MKTKAPDVDYAKCSEIAEHCTNSILRKTARVVNAIYDEAMRPTGLRGTQLSLLVALALLERSTVKRLAATIALDRTSLTRALAPLERDGLIESLGSEDGRERLLSLTKAGYERLAEATKQWDLAQGKVKAALGPGQWKGLTSSLKSAAKQLSK